MSWSIPKTVNEVIELQQETDHALPNATTNYGSEIDFIRPNRSIDEKYITVIVTPDGAPSADVDVMLYGAWESGGTKFLLMSFSSKLTSGKTDSVVQRIDINKYIAPYYYITFQDTTDESGVSVDITILQ